MGKSTMKDIQNSLAEQLENIFDLVIKEREKHYRKKPEELPDKGDVRSIINGYSSANAAISGGLNLVPGPLGLVAIIPELAIIIRNQLSMICDIGYAYGHQKGITKETLLYVFGVALGTGGLGLGIIQGNKLLIKRVSLRVFQKIVTWLGGKITQRALKAVLAKWLPLAGAAAMAVWSHYSTNQVGKKANEIFSKFDIETIDADEKEEADILNSTGIIDSELNNKNLNYKFLHIKALINLMKIDGKILEVEKDYIREKINASNLDKDEISILEEKLNTPSDDKFDIDFTTFRNRPDQAIALLIDLIALSKRNAYELS
jgi:uncharacterized protein (DUF697 family)